MRSKCLHYFGRCFRCCSFALKQRRSFCTPFWGNDSVLYQHAREIISARKTSRTHNNKDPSRLRELSPRWRVKTRYINSTKRTSLSLFSSVVLFFRSFRISRANFVNTTWGKTTTEGHVCTWPANSALPAGSCGNEVSAKKEKNKWEIYQSVARRISICMGCLLSRGNSEKKL